MKNEKMRQIAFAGLAISLLALFAASAGVLNENIYKEAFVSGAISERLLTGSIAQDFVTAPLSLLLLVFALRQLVSPNESTTIAMMGLIGYFFYAYGLYVIQGQYTSLYIIYMLIFALSIYTLIFGLAGFEKKWLEEKQFSKGFRLSVSVFIFVMLIILGPLWMTMMFSDMANRVPGETYGVFILDLCIVFPALAISIVEFYRKSALGTLLAGVGLVKIFTVCLSVAFGEWFVVYSGVRILDGFMLGTFALLTLISLVFIFKYFSFLRMEY